MQGLALGGEYGGAATYVAEHAPHNRRGLDTSWIQTTATLGFFLALLVIGTCRIWMDAKVFADWGWRIPFWLSLVLLVFSVYIRLKLNESPIFQKMKAEGKGSKSPLKDSFLKYPNNKYVLLALLGATAGQGVVWYTGQFYALFFLTITLKLDYISAYKLIGLSLLIGTPFFLFFGWLSDKIGRLKIIMAGCLIAALTYFPLFGALTHYVNPALEAFAAKTPITVAATDCKFHIFVGPWSKFSDCDRVKDFLTKQGLSFKSVPAEAGKGVVTTIGDARVEGWDQKKLDRNPQGGGPRFGRRSGQGQLGDGRNHPRHHGSLRDDGLRTDRGIPGGVVPDQHSLHVDVAALSHRQRLVRRHVAADGYGDGGSDGRHLLRTVVPDRRRADDPGHRLTFPARNEEPGHPNLPTRVATPA